jgi:hypothetical protein
MIYETVCDIGSNHEILFIETLENQVISRDYLLLRGTKLGQGKRIGRLVKVSQTTNPTETSFKVIEEVWVDFSQVSLDEYMANKVKEEDCAEIITTEIHGEKVKVYKLS